MEMHCRARPIEEKAQVCQRFIAEMIPLFESGALRLFVPVRGDPSITWVDFYPSDQETDCGGSGNPPKCDEDHSLTQLRDDVDFGKRPLERAEWAGAIDNLGGDYLVWLTRTMRYQVAYRAETGFIDPVYIVADHHDRVNHGALALALQ